MNSRWTRMSLLMREFSFGVVGVALICGLILNFAGKDQSMDLLSHLILLYLLLDSRARINMEDDR